MEINNLNEIFAATEFKVFTDVITDGGLVAGIKLEGQETSRKVFDEMTEYAKNDLGFGGLAYIKFNADGEISSPIKKFLSEGELAKLKEQFSPADNDVIIILSGAKRKVLDGLVN